MTVHKKEGIILGSMIVLFVASWVLFAGAYFGVTNVTAVSPWVFVFLAFLAYAVALTIEIDRKHWILGTLIAGLSPIPFFRADGGGWSYLLIVAGSFVLFAFFYWGAKRAKEERVERVSLRLWRVLPRGVGRAMTGFSLAMALFFLASPLSAIDVPTVKIPPRFLGDVVFPLSRLAGVSIPSEVADLTADEVGALLAFVDGEDASVVTRETLTLIAKSDIDLQEQDVFFQLISDEEIFFAVRSDIRSALAVTPVDIIEDRRGDLSERFNIEIDGDETLGVVFGAAISKAYLQPKTLEEFSEAMPILLAATLFGAIRLAGILVMWLIVLLTWIALKVLRKTGVIRREVITIEKENFVL